MSTKTGILGGTFNPPHNGHLSAAMRARRTLGLDQVLFIPTNIPPHKQLPAGSATTEQPCASATDRILWIRRARLR